MGSMNIHTFIFVLMCLYESLSVLLVIGLEGTMCKLHPVADGGYGMDDPGNIKHAYWVFPLGYLFKVFHTISSRSSPVYM